MNKTPIYLALILLLVSCGDGNPVPSTTVIPESGSAISTSEKIVITFSREMDDGTLALGGSMAADSDQGVWSSVDRVNDTLTISPVDHWNANQAGTLTINASGTNGYAIVELDLEYKIQMQFSQFQNASVVIGQPGFTSNQSNQGLGSPTSKTISSPYGNPFFLSGSLFVSDYSNDRVLKFNSVPTNNNKAADLVLGQPNFTATGSSNMANGMHAPETVQIYGSKMFIGDFHNSRILIWNPAPTADDEPADIVVGQAGFGANVQACSASGLGEAESFYVVDGKLIVADSTHHRVMIWNSIPGSDGEMADIVLGQNDFTHCRNNDDDQNGVADANPTARTLNYPSGVWSDGTKLVVTDSDNNRTLIWNTFPTADFQPADLVLGQADFTHHFPNDDDHNGTTDSTSSSRTMSAPSVGVFSNGSQLFVADGINNRILIWNTFPTTNFKAADAVIGQSDFVHFRANDSDQNNTNNVAASSKTFDYPTGFSISGNKLIVADNGNHRFLIFESE